MGGRGRCRLRRPAQTRRQDGRLLRGQPRTAGTRGDQLAMLLRRFNAAGVDRFRAFIATLNVDDSPPTKSLPAPFELLEEDALTEVIQPETECPDAKFANRLAAAKYLDEL